MTQIIRQEPLISENRRPQLRQLIVRLLEKLSEEQHDNFVLFKARPGGQRGFASAAGAAVAAVAAVPSPRAWLSMFRGPS